jgi:uncharacterized membrane protein YsdA (DUF1294 family)/cold shock CspA family protein
MQREKGHIVAWDDDKGYGYISAPNGGKDVFLHAKDLSPSQRRPRVGDRVTYLFDDTSIDRPIAAEISICGFAWSFFTLLCVSVIPLLGCYVISVRQHLLPLYPFTLAYICMSLITVVVYHHDKNAAKAGAWRVSERNLHALELLGGWPGAFLAQIFFRHKLKKISYQITFWSIILAHIVAWYSLTVDSPVRTFAREIPERITYLTDYLKPENLQNIQSNTVPSSSKPERILSKLILFQAAPQEPPQAEPLHVQVLEPPPPPISVVWTNEPPPEPIIIDPTARRSIISAPPQIRRLQGKVKAVSAVHGVLVSLAPDINADGLIDPTKLVDDFQRRFRVGEPVTVAIQRICMRGRLMQVELYLVEP